MGGRTEEQGRGEPSGLQEPAWGGLHAPRPRGEIEKMPASAGSWETPSGTCCCRCCKLQFFPNQGSSEMSAQFLCSLCTSKTCFIHVSQNKPSLLLVGMHTSCWFALGVDIWVTGGLRHENMPGVFTFGADLMLTP